MKSLLSLEVILVVGLGAVLFLSGLLIYMGYDLLRPPALVTTAVVPAVASSPAVRGCYDQAMAAFWLDGVAAARGEDLERTGAAVARAVAFDPELAALWEAAQSSEEAFVLFARLLHAKAWSGQCSAAQAA